MTGPFTALNRSRLNKHPRGRIWLYLTAAAILAVITPRTLPLLVWNATASAPVGLYRVIPFAHVDRGNLVLAMAPIAVRTMAAERGYLPAGVPLVKHVAALFRDQVCTTGHEITINGRPVATRLSTDSHRRPLPHWQGCRMLARDEVFLLNAPVRDSFDSRYFGPIRISAVMGRLIPLWTF
ncbi:MAG: S26 family signal peptidase [Alphaproteobacteria bacterium]|nr:S26 family signal peptidase [Alphaproteobacteria bacterium]MDE2112916.1 S26 family signal peptidase [Alphaproteobacteria bacterium]MDE2493785.1 S26 family signal peptidase [Alphaproteobacteria bacterium]